MSELKIPIKIISDVVCPWCIIGYKRLERGIAIFNEQNPDTTVVPDIEWLPFELNPTMPQGGENLRAHLAAKYGTTLEGSIAARKKLNAIGADLGFSFDYFDDMRMYNTRKAHKLIHWAAQYGKQQQLKMAMFLGFFSERKVMDDDATLLAITESEGLDKTEAQKVLNDKELDNTIVDLQNQWRQQGIQAVPAFIFNNKYQVSGAQEPEAFVQLLGKL